jgi:PPM family protein phosphatase
MSFQRVGANARLSSRAAYAEPMSRTMPRFDFRVEFAQATDVGLVRQTNEDALLANPDSALFGIADGMGGHAGGEVAARTALDAAQRWLTRSEATEVLEGYVADPSLDRRRAIFALLRGAAEAANQAVIDEASRKSQLTGMGTTLDLALLVRNRAFVAHVGDSRVYLVRPTTMLQLTQDHVLQEPHNGHRGAGGRRAPVPLVNAVGMRSSLSCDTVFVDLSRGDRLLLCTDGVHGALETEASLARMCSKGTPAEINALLLAQARKDGGRDNASALVIEVCERFVKRPADDGIAAQELTALEGCALLVGLPPSAVLAALAAGVEVEVAAGEKIQREVTSDLVAYIVVDGLVELADGRRLGPPGLLFAESLVGVKHERSLPTVLSPHARLIRIRQDDFAEVCHHDPPLAARLYRRLARYLASLTA